MRLYLYYFCIVYLYYYCVVYCLVVFFETCFISICCSTGLFIYETNMHLCTYWASCKVPVSLSEFNVTWILPTNFRNKLTYQISLNLSNGSRVASRRRMNRQTWLDQQSLFAIYVYTRCIVQCFGAHYIIKVLIKKGINK